MAIYFTGSSGYRAKYKYQPVFLKLRNPGMIFFLKETRFHKAEKTLILIKFTQVNTPYV